MSFIAVATAIGFEGLAIEIAAGAMMGGSITMGTNVLRGKNPFDNIGQGLLLGGLTAGVMQGFSAAGVSSTAAEEAVKQGALTPDLVAGPNINSLGNPIEAGAIPAPTPSSVPTPDIYSSVAPSGGMESLAPPTGIESLVPQAPVPVTEMPITDQLYGLPAETVNPANVASSTPMQTEFGPTTSTLNPTSELTPRGNPTDFTGNQAHISPASDYKGTLPSSGLPSLKQAGQFAKDNWKMLTGIAAIGLLNQPKPGVTAPTRDSGGFHTGYYDPVTHQYVSTGGYVPYKDFGNKDIRDYTHARNGGLMGLANGGAVAFADGGSANPDDLAAIEAALARVSGASDAERNTARDQLLTTYDPFTLSQAPSLSQFGDASAYGTAAQGARERMAGNTSGGIANIPPVPDYSTDPGRDTAFSANTNAPPQGPVLGPYDPNAAAFKRDPGTTAQGYSRNYSPEELTTIAGTFDQYRDNPTKLMELMSQYGVSVKDLALARTGSGSAESLQGYNNIFTQAGAKPGFGGMYTAADITPKDKAYIDNMLAQPDGMGGTLADTYKKQGIDPYTNAGVIAQAKAQNERVDRRVALLSSSGSTPALYDRSGQQNNQIAPWLNPNAKADQDAFNAQIAARNAAQTAASPGVVLGGGVIKPDGTYSTSGPNASNTSNPYSTAQPVMKDGHLVDPVTGHLINPTLTAAQLQQARDGVNTDAEMRQAYNGYWDTVKPGDILDFAGGTLTMNKDGTSTHTYTDASGKQQSYTFSKGTDFATVARNDPNIAQEWKSMFNYVPPNAAGGTGGAGQATQTPTGWTPPTAPATRVPTSIQDFNTRFNTMTPGGDSGALYDYLMGKPGATEPKGTTNTEVAAPYWEKMGMAPVDKTRSSRIYDPNVKNAAGKVVGGYVPNPDFKPKVFDPVTKRLVEAVTDTDNKDKKPNTPPDSGKQWVWNDTTKQWTQVPIDNNSGNNNGSQNGQVTGNSANGGLMRSYAAGGLGSLGGYSDGGQLLRGDGDGVSDSIPASIGGRQPARLADGEFVVPARIVSELGNGSTEAGARRLYQMMDRVQNARKQSIGKNKVATNSRADKYLPV